MLLYSDYHSDHQFNEIRYPLDWSPWDVVEENPHIRLRDGTVLRICQFNSGGNKICAELELLSSKGWISLFALSDFYFEPSELKNGVPHPRQVLINNFIYRLMKYAEYLFAGKSPDVENTYPKWKFPDTLVTGL